MDDDTEHIIINNGAAKYGVGILNCTSDHINGKYVGIQKEETIGTVKETNRKKYVNTDVSNGGLLEEQQQLSCSPTIKTPYEVVNEKLSFNGNGMECDSTEAGGLPPICIPKSDLFLQFEGISLDPGMNVNGEEELNQSNDDDALPLKGTVVFVDVRAENENRSKAISREVERLGSVVVRKINCMVTHVIFKDGRSGTITQVKKYPHIHVVSVLWVDACKTTISRVDESKYYVEFPGKHELPFPVHVKRVKSLQPKTLEEDVNNSGKKAERRRKRLRDQGKKTEDTPPDHIICMDNSQEYIKSSDLYKLVATPRVIPDTPWILNYINSSSHSETPVNGSDPAIIHNIDGSFDYSDVTSFTEIIQLSPSEPKKYNSSLLRTFAVPKRLSTELEESKESFLLVNTSDVSHDTNDDTVNYSRISNDGVVTTHVEDGNISIENSKDDTINYSISVEGCDISTVNQNSESNYIYSNSENLKGLSLVTTNEDLPEGKCEGKTISLNDMCTNSKSFISRKKKKLYSKTIPFKDSPLVEEEVDNGNPLSDAQYNFFCPNGNVIDPLFAMHNVETSRKLSKLKTQRKRLLKPFDNSPNCSFKTAESLQLRCPERKWHAKKGVNNECIDLISDMNDLKVNFDVPCIEEEKKDKDNIYRTKIKQRRSSGVDFKIMKNIKNASLYNKNKHCVKNNSQVYRTLSHKKNIYDNDSMSSPSSDDSDSDNTESIASNLSFVHDENKGLVICSQESRSSLIQDVDEVMNIDRNNIDSDSGISDTDVGCIEDANSLKNNQQLYTPITKKKTRRNATYKGKSPKVHSRSTNKSFSPYKSMKIKASLVSTSLHLSEQTFLKAMLKNLGGFIFRTNVANDTTHVIAGSDRRTLNILYAIVYGCWILSPKWVADSAESGKWLKEVDYEMHKEFPIAKFSRISRTRDGKSVLMNLFTMMPPIYIAEVTNPPSDELVKLVTLGGGQVTNSVRKAGVGIGIVNTRRKDLCTVTEKWVLDSISKGSALPTESYEHSIVLDNRESSPGF